MSSLENYCPQMKTGQWKPSGQRQIFQCELNSDNVVALTQNEFEITQFFDGKKTISDIIHELHEKNKAVSFRQIILTIQKVAKSDCLEGNSPWNEQIEKQAQAPVLKKHAIFEPFAKVAFIPRCGGANLGQGWIVLLNAPLILLALSSLLAYRRPSDAGAFLKIHDSYFWGAILFYVASSIFLALRDVWKVFVNFMSFDTTPKGDLNLGFFSVSPSCEEI